VRDGAADVSWNSFLTASSSQGDLHAAVRLGDVGPERPLHGLALAGIREVGRESLEVLAPAVTAVEGVFHQLRARNSSSARAVVDKAPRARPIIVIIPRAFRMVISPISEKGTRASRDDTPVRRGPRTSRRACPRAPSR